MDPAALAPRAGELAHHVDRAAILADHRISDATRAVYARHWRAWCTWASAHGVEKLPADPVAVAAHVAALDGEGASLSLIGQRLAAIGYQSERAGHDRPGSSPEVRSVLGGLRRERAGSRPRGAAPVTVETLGRLAALPCRRLIETRDRALVLVGFASGLRRSELAALSWGDVDERPEGVALHVRRSKTDQTGRGRVVGVVAVGGAACAVGALRRWMAAARDRIELRPPDYAPPATPLFVSIDRHGRQGGRLSARGVRRAVDRECARIGIPPGTYSAHSLRSGMATEGARFGHSDRALARQGGWTRRETVDRYVRSGAVFRDSPSRVLAHASTSAGERIE